MATSIPLPRFKSFVEKVSAGIDARVNSDAAGPPWIKRVAMLTGVLAALSGFLAVRSTILTNDAIYASGQAILSQTQSSDAWAEYQADSVKARVVETALLGMAAGGNRDVLTREAKDLRSRQPPLRATALGKAADRDRHLKQSVQILAERDWLGYAGFAAQLGIALASVAALIRARRMLYAGVVAGGASVIILVYAFAIHFAIVP